MYINKYIYIYIYIRLEPYRPSCGSGTSPGATSSWPRYENHGHTSAELLKHGCLGRVAKRGCRLDVYPRGTEEAN